MNLYRFLGLASMLAAGLAGGTASAADWPVREHTLDNGLTVLVRPDSRAPVAVSQLWYRIGSSYEHNGITGISHVLEHMMFKGTERHPAGEFSEIISRQGGRHNAFTGRDYTTYYEQLAADRLEVAFELEADRMHNLRLDQGEFRKERDVVVEERRLRVEDRPMARFSERANTISYPVSPYGQPIIGWPEDLRNLALPDLERWYRRWYSPANAILVVVGDVEPQRVFELAEKHFGQVPAGEAPQAGREARLQAPGERRLTVRDGDARVPHVMLSYQVPSGATVERRRDAYALMLMAQVLDGGRGARLAEELVRGKGLATSVGAGYDPVARLDTRFSLQGTPTADQGPEALEQALAQQVRRLQEEPVTEDELERARNQLLADYLFNLDSMFHQAIQIGMLEATGIGWEELERFEEGIRAVTPEDIRAVARRYFTPERLSVAVLQPGAREENR